MLLIGIYFYSTIGHFSELKLGFLYLYLLNVVNPCFAGGTPICISVIYFPNLRLAIRLSLDLS